MGVIAPLRAALRLFAPAMRGRSALVAGLALIERLLAPALAYAFFFRGTPGALLIAATMSATLACRGAAQRAFATRNETELYRRAVAAVLGGDVLQPTLLPDEEARISLFQGLHRIGALLADTLPNLAANLIAAAVLSVAVAAFEPVRVTLVAVLALTTGGAGLFICRRWVDLAQTEAWRAWDRVAEGVTDACEGRLELVAAGRDRDFLGRFSDATRRWDERASHAGWIAGLLGRLPMALIAAAVGAAVVIDARLHGDSWAVAGVHAGVLAGFAPTFFGIARCLQELTSEEHRLRVVVSVLDATIADRRGTVEPEAAPARIEWKGVRFAYAVSGGEALHDVSFVWRSGEVLALAGPNGSGKSTCLRVLLGLGELKSGAVLVDGIRLEDLNFAQWRRTIAFLPQRPYLPLRATVRECLAFIDVTTAEDVMRHALERVGLVQRSRRESGDLMDLRVGSLSVGERQRLALARLLCRAAPIVLLDEPDANLDRDGVQLVADLVMELARESMVLVVAHTPELLGLADRVVTLDGGTVCSDAMAKGAAQTG